MKMIKQNFFGANHILLFLLFFLSFLGYSQTLHIVEANANRTFVPSDITINIGDAVRWVNMGGLHNVVADDGSFTSGNPSSGNWVFEVVFNVVGDKRYYCSEHGNPGGIGMSGIVRVIDPTGISEANVNLKMFHLNQNYPNPFNPSTFIGWQSSVGSWQTLKIFDVLGNEIATLVNEWREAGSHSVKFDASGLASGIYYYKLTTGNFTSTKKMLMVK